MNKRVHPCTLVVKVLNIKLFSIFYGIAILLTSRRINAETISASHAIFNFSFWPAKDNEFLVTISNLPATLISSSIDPGRAAMVATSIYSAPFPHLSLTKQLEKHFIINPKLPTHVHSYPTKIFQLIPV